MKKKILTRIVFYLYFFFSLLFYNSINWVINLYGIITIDEIFFYFQSSGKGTESSLITRYINSCLFMSIYFSLIIFIIINIIRYIYNSNKIQIVITFFKKRIKVLFSTNLILIIGYIMLFGISIYYIYMGLAKLDFYNYLKISNTNSTFIEDNYVDAGKTNINFPENKKNLIYIYVESLESSSFDRNNGGLKNVNILNPLINLTNENVNFSDSSKFGGFKYLNGTNWTTGGIVATTSGLPLKISADGIVTENLNDLMGGVTTLGDILAKLEYNQEFMIGSNKEFGNRRIYFEKHGNYKIYDYESPKEAGILPWDYNVWWGFEDSKLYEYAKDEIQKLSKENKPFNFTMLTANTHFPDGLIEDSCNPVFENHYDNSIYCSAIQINQFVRWIQTQDFYKDTIIVITGDHLTMQANYYEEDVWERGVYNLFINVDKTEYDNKNRTFTALDIFPTVISALGGEIEGDRLGLGTNLFSNRLTLPEEMGLEEFNNEVSYRSIFYNKYLLK